MHIPKHGHHGPQGPHIGVASPVYGGISFDMSGSLTQPSVKAKSTKPKPVTKKPKHPSKPKPRHSVETKPTKPKPVTKKPTQPSKPKPQPTKPTQVTKEPTQLSKSKPQPSVAAKPTKPTQVTKKPTQPSKPKPQPTKPTQVTKKPTQPSKPKPQPTKPTQVTKKPTQPSKSKPQPTKPTQVAKKPTQPSKSKPQPTKPTQVTKKSTQSSKPKPQPTKPTQASKTQDFVPAYHTGSTTPKVTDSKMAVPQYNGGEKEHIRKRDLQRDLDTCKKEALKLGKGSKAAQKKALKHLKKRTSKYMNDLDKFDVWKKWDKQPKNLNKNMKKVPNYKNMSKREILKDLQSTRAEVNKLEFGNEGHQAKILAEVKKRSAKYKKAVDNYKFGKGKSKTTRAHKSKGKRGPIKDGEKVKVNGRLHYDSWGAKPGMTEHNATMKISHTAKGHKYPVHVSTLKGLRQGWVKADEVTTIKGKGKSAKNVRVKGRSAKKVRAKGRSAKKGHTVYASIPNEPGSASPQAGLQY